MIEIAGLEHVHDGIQEVTLVAVIAMGDIPIERREPTPGRKGGYNGEKEKRLTSPHVHADTTEFAGIGAQPEQCVSRAE